jgi:DNA-binding NarL/FixJ family response regulator
MKSSKILVVDDFEPFLQYICAMLRERVELQLIGKASDGLEAVQKARELQPDLILLDVGLPKLNGIEAARQIRRIAPNAKLLFVSQESSSDVVRETFGIGALGYVHKQHLQSDLLPAIEAVLASRQFVSSGLEFREAIDAHLRHVVQF